MTVSTMAIIGLVIAVLYSGFAIRHLNNRLDSKCALIGDLMRRIEALEADYDRRQGDGR